MAYDIVEKLTNTDILELLSRLSAGVLQKHFHNQKACGRSR